MNSIGPDSLKCDQANLPKQAAKKEKILLELFMTAVQQGLDLPYPIQSKLVQHDPKTPMRKNCAQGFE